MKQTTLLLATFLFVTGALQAAKPNFILIFADDQGYGDLSCFGSKTIDTPNIDRIAKEGRKFTSFMVASPVCTPSRAALLTGCYPKRVGMHQHFGTRVALVDGLLHGFAMLMRLGQAHLAGKL